MYLYGWHCHGVSLQSLFSSSSITRSPDDDYGRTSMLISGTCCTQRGFLIHVVSKLQNDCGYKTGALVSSINRVYNRDRLNGWRSNGQGIGLEDLCDFGIASPSAAAPLLLERSSSPHPHPHSHHTRSHPYLRRYNSAMSDFFALGKLIARPKRLRRSKLLSTVFDLPEMTDIIFSHLSRNDLVPWACVSKKWHYAVIPHIWRDLSELTIAQRQTCQDDRQRLSNDDRWIPAITTDQVLSIDTKARIPPQLHTLRCGGQKVRIDRAIVRCPMVNDIQELLSLYDPLYPSQRIGIGIQHSG